MTSAYTSPSNIGGHCAFSTPCSRLDVREQDGSFTQRHTLLFSAVLDSSRRHKLCRPDEFLPESCQRNTVCDRWEERTLDNDRDVNGPITIGNRRAMLAFSSGSRNCVGQSFALQIVPTLVAAMLRSFTFELVDADYQIDLERYGASQVPVGGIPILINKRKNKQFRH
jgi:Cytochrome P450